VIVPETGSFIKERKCIFSEFWRLGSPRSLMHFVGGLLAASSPGGKWRAEGTSTVSPQDRRAERHEPTPTHLFITTLIHS
jgi:hypothetical protein